MISKKFLKKLGTVIKARVYKPAMVPGNKVRHRFSFEQGGSFEIRRGK